ncbi:MAG: HAMP domain-containing sensor histidine kinase [Chthoniobacteraceae bacterium]
MKNWPLKTRLVLWTAVVGVLSVALFGGIIGFTLRKVTRDNIDSVLKREAGTVFDGLAHLGHPMNWSNEAEVTKLFSSVVSLYTFEVEEPLGKVVYRSRELSDVPLPKSGDGVAYTGPVGGNVVARILQLTRGSLRLRVAVDLNPFIQWEASMWRTYLIVLPTALVLLAVGARWLYGRTLKPVDDIVAAAERITADRLEQRLPVISSRDEIGHLTTVINEMIDRLQLSFEQARRFSADASHELKTPLTIIRGELEMALRTTEIPHGVERTMLDLLDETGRLINIVEGLLLLSQADAGKFPVGREAVELTELIEELADDIEILAARLEIRVELHLAPSVRVMGSAQFLRQLVLNLFDNAIKYNRHAGTIRCELTSAGGMAVFRIANTGENIPTELRERIFNRFFRVESSRARTPAGGQGLGLSIAREIVRAHNGTLTIENAEPGWTVFQFSIPLCDSSRTSEAGKLLPVSAKSAA